jgi:hypothetical protein
MIGSVPPGSLFFPPPIWYILKTGLMTIVWDHHDNKRAPLWEWLPATIMC